MSDYIGTREQVDEYVGSRLVEAAYLGSRKYYDAYSEVSGSLPLVYESRVEHILKNYRIYGTSEGAGEETENIVEDYLEQAYISTTSGGVIVSYSSIDLALFQIVQGETYTIKRFESSMELYAGFFTSKPIMGSVTYDETIHVPQPTGRNVFTFEAPITGWAAVRSSRTVAKQKSIVAVQGSTAPSTYVPYGYQIPLVNMGKNLININDISAITLASSSVRYGVQIDTPGTYYLKAFNTVTGYLYAQVSEGSSVISSLNILTPSTQNEGVLTVLSGQKLSIYDAAANHSKTQAITLFSSSEITCTPGSTAPASYPLYIGSSKLGEEEYLAYESGKVYKRTENLWDPQNADASKGYRIGYLYSDGRTENLDTWRITEYVEVEPNTDYTLLWTSNPSPSATAPAIVEYSADKIYLRGTAYSAHNVVNITTHTDTRYVRFSTTAASWGNNVPRFNKGTSVVNLPYYQPVDPPVPLPAIIAYKGENTLSSTETLGPVTVKGRINTPST